MKSPRILHLTSTLGMGGVEKMLLASAAELGRRGKYRPVVCNLTGRQSPELLAQFENHAYFKLVNLNSGTQNMLSILPKLLKVCLNKRPILVHAHQVATFFWAALISRIFDIPCVCHIHSFGYANNSLRLILPFLLLSKKISFIMVSRTVKEHFVKNYPSLKRTQTVVLYNALPAVPIPSGPSLGDWEAMRIKLFSLNKNGLLVGFVGRLSPEKDLSLLFQALEPLFRSCKKNYLKLVIAGDGPCLGELQSLAKSLSIADKIVFLGNCVQLEQIYPLLDLLVLPSQKEGFSLVTLEALAHGIPVICSDGVAATEVLGDYVTVFRANDVAQLKRSIQQFIGDPLAMQQRAALGKDAVLKYYSMPNYAAQLEALYSSWLEEVNI